MFYHIHGIHTGCPPLRCFALELPLTSSRLLRQKVCCLSFCFREKEGFCHFLPAAAGFSQFLSRTSRQGVLLLSPLPPTQSEPVSPFSMKKGLTFSRFRERKKCANCPVFDSCVNSCYSFTENVRRAICRLFDTYVISYYSFTTGTRQKIQCRFDTYVISCYSFTDC